MRSVSASVKDFLVKRNVGAIKELLRRYQGAIKARH